uniref:Caspase recruitment domain-containing protein 19 n=1 Tax=Strigops habroptila TaxID=2489341 RepID=A0A672TZA8_STRHB
MLYKTYQSYCHRLQHDMYFLTSNSRLNEQVVDKIILQLNRVYPQILTNAEAEKFRNPKASLHTRLSDLIKHLQKKGERHCQEFYRALQISAEQLYNDLPSRKVLKTTDSTEIDTGKEKYMLNDRGPVFFLACFSVAAGFALFWYCCNSERRKKKTRHSYLCTLQRKTTVVLWSTLVWCQASEIKDNVTTPEPKA